MGSRTEDSKQTPLAQSNTLAPTNAVEESLEAKTANQPGLEKKARKRTTPPTPSLDVILKASLLPIRLMPLRYPGTTQSALRHMVWKAEFDRRNPGIDGNPSGFASCIVRPENKRQVLIDCVVYEELLRGQRIGGKASVT